MAHQLKVERSKSCGQLFPIPDLTRPDLTRPELAHPDLTHPDLTNPEAILASAGLVACLVVWLVGCLIHWLAVGWLAGWLALLG